jgi:hypothetical protein
MNLVVTIYTVLLFFILTPGVLLRIPKKGSIRVVAMVHAAVFAIVYYLTHKLVWRFSSGFRHEGFTEGLTPQEIKQKIDDVNKSIAKKMDEIKNANAEIKKLQSLNTATATGANAAVAKTAAATTTAAKTAAVKTAAAAPTAAQTAAKAAAEKAAAAKAAAEKAAAKLKK